MTANTNPTNPSIVVVKPDTLDPHGLIASGELLATPKELAQLLGLSRSELDALLHRELAGRVRFVRTPPGGGKWRYSVSDAKAAIAPLLPAIEEARKRRAEVQAKDQAEAAKRKAERWAAHEVHVARKDARGQRGRPGPMTPGRGEPGAPSSPPPPSERRPMQGAPVGPEVFVRRRLGAG